MLALLRGSGFKFKRALSQRGFWGTLRRGTAYLVWEYTVERRRRRYREAEMAEFDRRFAVNTSGKVDLQDLNINSPNLSYGVSYESTPPEIFKRMVDSLPIKHEEFSFVDVGSGKGKVLLMASELPFKKIIGIEFSSELHRIAQQNVSAYQSPNQRCKTFECICVDASECPIPSDPLVFFFYHPFDDKVMRRVLTNIESSLKDHPRRMFILYYNPVCDYLLDSTTLWKKIKATVNYAIYMTGDA